MTSAAVPQQRASSTLARRALSNVLIGVAIGLLAYYAITDVESGVAQRGVRENLEKLGPVAAASPQVVGSGTAAPVLDFGGWVQQDLRFWTEAKPGDSIGRLVVADMRLDSVVVKGTDRQSLKSGPGWVATTNVPGPTGNCAISGHRTTYLAPFRRIDQLRAGDVIDLYTPFRRYRYRVTRNFTVRPWQVEVIAPTEKPTLTLTACHPPYSARYRLIVQSDLVDVRPLKGVPTGLGQ